MKIGLAALLAALVSQWFTLSASSAPQYFLHLWQTEDGLPQNAVSAIVQARNGYLWLGTYSGLVRFDGVRFVLFDNNNTPELQTSRVTSLYEDRDSTLWIGHETGELTRYHQGRFEVVQTVRSGKARKVSALGSDEAGDVWMMNEEGLMTRARDNLVLVPPAGPALGQLAFAVDRAQHIWLARQGKLSKLEHGKLTSVLLSGESPDVYVQGLCASVDGGVWIASDGRLRKWQANQWTQDLGQAPWGLAGLSQFLEAKNGCLVAGTVDQGLFLIVAGQKVLEFNRTNGLPQNWIRSLCEDREGNLWAGVGGSGMAALREAKVATVNPPDHWQGRAVLSVSGNQEHDLWVGTEGAGMYHRKEGQWEQFAENAGLANSFVWSVTADRRGQLWVGTWGGGVFLERNGRFAPVPQLENVRAPSPAILHGSHGVTWIGTAEGLIRYEDGQVARYGEAEGLELPDVHTLAEAPDGALWFGMFGGGLARLSEGALKQFRAHDGLSSDFVQCLKFDDDGTLWIGTSGGLTRMKNGRFASITSNHGLADNVICHIEDDGKGFFWMSSHRGIMRISKAELNTCADGTTNQVNSLTYGKGEGMPTLECMGGMQPSGCKTADGRLWFPTSKGLVVLDPKDLKKNLLPPPVFIEEFRVDDKLQTLTARNQHDGGFVAPKQSPAGLVALKSGEGGSGVRDGGAPHLEIPPGRHRFEFYYTGLSFTVPEKVRFRYRLQGLDPDWVEAGNKRSVNYSYIPPGDYTFRVIACNNDDVWSEQGASIEFKVLPQFWQTWWFRVFIGVLGASVVAATVLAITRRRMKRNLERLERQRAVERERTRIAKDIHDDLGASLTRITMLSQSARADLDGSPAASDMDRIYDTAREMTRAMDEIVWAVNPQHDTLDSLATYLGRFAQGFLAAAHIRCRLDMPMQLPPWPVTAEIRHNFFLAFKEALHNAVKHSKTTEVRIAITIDSVGFSLSVEDEGCGFDPGAWERPLVEPFRPGSGNGLANMRQRLAEIGGRCEIRSAPAAGAQVIFRVPVKVAMT
jgi:signal transduction histidine kinase/ligand-binding sensor domain-containing protein